MLTLVSNCYHFLPSSQGRDILQSTVDLVRDTLRLEVIYGDTDSIMVHTGTTDIKEALAMGNKIKKEVCSYRKPLG